MDKDKNLYVTSSTGISAYNINGITLHNWAGIPYIEVYNKIILKI